MKMDNHTLKAAIDLNARIEQLEQEYDRLRKTNQFNFVTNRGIICESFPLPDSSIREVWDWKQELADQLWGLVFRAYQDKLAFLKDEFDKL